MKLSTTPAAITLRSTQKYALSGAWTARGIDSNLLDDKTMATPARGQMVMDGGQIEALDSVGAWVLQKFLHRLRQNGAVVEVSNLPPAFAPIMAVAAEEISHRADAPAAPTVSPGSSLESIGRSTKELAEQGLALFSFVGETSIALAGWIAHPARVR